MIDEQYKKSQGRAWKGEKRVWKGAKTALERGQERVLKGTETGFKRYKKRNLAKFENLKREKTALQPLSTSSQPFFTVPLFFHPFFMILAKNGKKGAKKCRNRKGKKSVFSCFCPIHVFYLSFPSTYLGGARYNSCEGASHTGCFTQASIVQQR